MNQGIIQSGGRVAIWRTHSAAAGAAAALTAAAPTPITIDHQYLGGAARWWQQEVDATVIR